MSCAGSEPAGPGYPSVPLPARLRCSDRIVLTGQWRTTGWWNAANALTAVINCTGRTGDRTYSRVIGRTLRAAERQHRDFLNRYFDDNGWWGLAWLGAYDLTGEQRYLGAAERIFANLMTGWDDTCGGGLWWNEDRRYKNAITNELFLALAARLHLRTAGRTVPTWTGHCGNGSGSARAA